LGNAPRHADALARELLARAAESEDPDPLVEAARVLFAQAKKDARVTEIRKAREA
jgi:hypothetical protein